MRSGLAVCAKVAAAAASEVGRTGGGTAISGVLNILLLPPRGLFVIASMAELCGGVLARCATMLLVLDLAPAPFVEAGLRVLARELAVGANSLDVAVDLLGLNMLAAALLLPSAALSSCAPFAGFGALLGAQAAGRRCDNEVVADERGRLPFVPMDEALLAEPASTLRRELVDDAGIDFVAVSADRGSVGPFGALLDADTVRAGAMLFQLAGPDGRDTGTGSFLRGPGFASCDSMPVVCDLVAAVVVDPEAFVGEPAPKFHTLRTIDFAEEKNPNRGFALPLSVRWVSRQLAAIPFLKREDILFEACGPTVLTLPCLLLLLFSFLASSIFRVAVLSLSACFSSASDFLGEMVSRRPLSLPPSPSRILTRFDIRLSSSSCTSSGSASSSSSSNPPGIPIRLREPALMTRVPALGRFAPGADPWPRTSDFRFFDSCEPRRAA